jgi:NADH dehydrogenase [ubiquinone] 1 alpha subcomplex assembly factor 5
VTRRSLSLLRGCNFVQSTEHLRGAKYRTESLFCMKCALRTAPMRICCSFEKGRFGLTIDQLKAKMKAKAPFKLTWKQAQYEAIWNKPSLAKEFTYLRTICADNLVERLDDVLKPIERAADLSVSGTGEIGRALLQAGRFDNIKKFDQFVLSRSQLNACPETYEGLGSCSRNVLKDWSRICPETLSEESYDLILSNLSLHWVNDINETLRQIRKALKPDGMFLGTMLGGDTLHELRASLAIAEQEREGGFSPHISPMLPLADASSLLSSAGLKLVTVDTAHIQIDFDNAFSAMRHLWWMGESNASTNRRTTVSRDTFLAAASLYQKLYGFEEGGKVLVPATFSIIFMIGWAPHETQKMPLEPGQGKVSLTKLGKGGAG